MAKIKIGITLISQRNKKLLVLPFNMPLLSPINASCVQVILLNELKKQQLSNEFALQKRQRYRVQDESLPNELLSIITGR